MAKVPIVPRATTPTTDKTLDDAESFRSGRAFQIFAQTVSAAAVTDSKAAKAADSRTIAAGSFSLADVFAAEEVRQADLEYRDRFGAEGEARRLATLQYRPVVIKAGREIGVALYNTVDAAQAAITETAIQAAGQGKRYDSAAILVMGRIDVDLPKFKPQEGDDDGD